MNLIRFKDSTMNIYQLLFVSLLFCVLSVIGCKESTSRIRSTAEPMHAPSGVRPGSHEDWCGEHKVPESLCTRCNPSLIPAFKATGDWCNEHNRPESQCLICNPNLKIERPPRKDSP